MGLHNATFELFDRWLRSLASPPETVVTLGVVDMPESREHYFAARGVKRLVAMDASAFEGAEFVHDLNAPLPCDHPLFGVADLVIDPGTCEHVFDLAEALRNVSRLCKPKAAVFHHAPLNWMNHGFHNPSPCCYAEWYRGNGWTVEQYIRHVNTMTRYTYRPTVTTIPPGERMQLDTIATRENVTTMESPQQARYAKGEWR